MSLPFGLAREVTKLQNPQTSMPVHHQHFALNNHAVGFLVEDFLVNGLFESFVIDYGPNLALTICCPKRSGNFHSGLTNIKPVKHKNMIYNRGFYLPKFENPILLRRTKRLIFLEQGPVQGP